ncbi:MAG: hypothetical protein E7528_07850 [Ruminococcaceae bacterium]|nr:hypothetical protein [Oscillospiraceae bacterium]
MICPHCKKENANEYAVVCAYCKNNMYPGSNPEEKAKELSKSQQKDSVSSSVKGVLSVILAIIVIIGVILIPKPSFDNKNDGETPVQNRTQTTTQNQQSQNTVTTTKASVIETPTQNPKMTYMQARNWLVEYAKTATYDAEEKRYMKVIKKYDTNDDSIALLSLQYYPESDALTLEHSVNLPDYFWKYNILIDKYETTAMSVRYVLETVPYVKIVSGKSTKDTYRPGVNIPCVDYQYGRRSEKPFDHTLEDERKASNDMSDWAAIMLTDFDEFLRKSNAGFDLTTLGYKSFYGI